MIKLQKSVLSLLLVIVMITAAVTGCTGTQAPATKPEKAASADASESPSAISEPAAECNAESYPIVNDKIELTFIIRKNALAEDYDAMPVVQEYEAKSNVHINWQPIPEEGFDEKKNLLFASNDMPDAFIGGGLTPYDEMTVRWPGHAYSYERTYRAVRAQNQGHV